MKAPNLSALAAGIIAFGGPFCNERAKSVASSLKTRSKRMLTVQDELPTAAEHKKRAGFGILAQPLGHRGR
jgi:hypothetical protein